MLSQAMVQSEKLIVSTGRQAAFITRLPTNQSVDPEFGMESQLHVWIRFLLRAANGWLMT